MANIGIVTFFHAFNYGAHLQAYAMLKLFEQAGHRVCVVQAEYPKEFLHDALQQAFAKSTYPAALLTRPVAARKMQSFNRRRLNLTKRLVTSSTEKMVRYINSLNLDALVCGSDEIWRANTPEIVPPSIYFLPPELKARRFAFAPSANSDHIFTDAEKAWLKTTFSGYSGIFVRDAAAANLVADALGTAPARVPDPTLLYPFDEFRALALPPLQSGGKKKVCFMLNQNLQGLVDKVQNGLAGEGCAFYSVYQCYRNTTFLPVSPEEFTTLFSQFDLVVTNMFHGTIFCLRNNAPFVTFDTQQRYVGRTSKVRELMRRFQLEPAHFSLLEASGEPLAQALDKMAELLQNGQRADHAHTLAALRGEAQVHLAHINDALRQG